jgi:drug/metabolite transporter (DMT)-like permease
LPFRSWLWAHAGRLSGIALGLLTFFGLIFLAAIGYTPAFGLLVLLVIGVTHIILGGRIRNA